MIGDPKKITGLLPSAEAMVRLRRWRMFKDGFATYGMGIGGIGVIVAIVLIFFYLLTVVFPMFVPADAEATAQYPIPAPAAGRTVHLAIEEQNDVGVRFTDAGHAVFFRTADGELLRDDRLPLPPGAQVASFAFGDPVHGVIGYGFSNGRAIVAKHVYELSYPEGRQVVTPKIEYPLGEKPIVVDDRGRPLLQLALQSKAESSTVVGLTADGRLVLAAFSKVESMLDETVTIERTSVRLPRIENVERLLLEPEQRLLYVADRSGGITTFDVSDKTQPQMIERVQVANRDTQIRSLRLLLGGISVLVGTSDGRVTQWIPVRDENNRYRLRRVREFKGPDGPIRTMVTEHRRKGFLTADTEGNVSIYHATAHRHLLSRRVTDGPIAFLAISPRGNTLFALDTQDRIHFWRVVNEHPEVSWSVLWQEVWYENYAEPKYLWQSSAATNDFEPKFSLMPLTFGTLKAAFYAMLIAVPLAIMGAIYTAYFMAPRMRALVKPTVEIMEALPTVILGFLAGLWLAPFVEHSLSGIFLLLLLLPLGTLLFAFAWNHAPKTIRHAVPDGWQAALLVPVLLIIVWAAFSFSTPLEGWLFGKDLRQWLTTDVGIDFDQRNSIVVGIAMGVAVIPTIFSITEDAIFSVPKHLTLGSLALGATPWQTLARVVMLTASPGVFSATMIGLGRAVGETMIVLMATGNTPVMDFSIFQGMRTLSANIAVEMPESEVDSSHYRVLFLAALVLFLFTFVANTAAELVRQRLRRKYSSL